MRTAAQTFRANDSFDATKAILELGVGEALVSFLDVGRTASVERVRGAAAVAWAHQRRRAPCAGRRQPHRWQVRPGGRSRSAYEVLMGRAQAQSAPADQGGARRCGQYGAAAAATAARPPPSPWGHSAPLPRAATAAAASRACAVAAAGGAARTRANRAAHRQHHHLDRQVRGAHGNQRRGARGDQGDDRRPRRRDRRFIAARRARLAAQVTRARATPPRRTYARPSGRRARDRARCRPSAS